MNALQPSSTHTDNTHMGCPLTTPLQGGAELQNQAEPFTGSLGSSSLLCLREGVDSGNPQQPRPAYVAHLPCLPLLSDAETRPRHSSNRHAQAHATSTLHTLHRHTYASAHVPLRPSSALLRGGAGQQTEQDPRGPLDSLSPLCQRRQSPVVNPSHLTTHNTTSTRNTLRPSCFAHRAHSS